MLRIAVTLAFLILAIVAPRSADAAPAEGRCTALGNICRCSEPLDFSTTNFETQSSAFDPPDSEGAGAKECKDGPAISSNGGNTTQTTVTAASTGLPGTGTTRVLQYNMYTSGDLRDSNLDFSHGTWCGRTYFRFGPAYAGANSTDPKWLRNDGSTGIGDNPPHPTLQTAFVGVNGYLEWAPGYGNYWCHGSPDPCDLGSPQIAHQQQLVSRTDCSQSWCRSEVCYDHDEQNNGTNHLRWRGKLVRLDNGKTDYVNDYSPNSYPAAVSGSSRIILTFIDALNQGGNTWSDYVWASHAMVAIKQPADPNFWIGVASEIEPDADNDGVPDVLDNCVNIANAGALDCDSDQDGYGNECDCDLNETGGCQGSDLLIWQQAFAANPETNQNANFNCSPPQVPGGPFLDGSDLLIWRRLFKNTGTQFKSGLSCANPNSAGGCPN